MSADNYLAIRKRPVDYGVEEWLVTQGFASDFSEGNESVLSSHVDLPNAIRWAADYMENHVVEYGIVAIDPDSA